MKKSLIYSVLLFIGLFIIFYAFGYFRVNKDIVIQNTEIMLKNREIMLENQKISELIHSDMRKSDSVRVLMLENQYIILENQQIINLLLKNKTKIIFFYK